MTAEEMKADGAPLEGTDITPKQDEGVLKVPAAAAPRPYPLALTRRPVGRGRSGPFSRASGCSRGARPPLGPVCPLRERG